MKKEIIDAISSSSAKSEFLWVVRYPTNEYMGVKYNSHIFDDFISKYYTVQAIKTFYKGTKVLFIQKKANVRKEDMRLEKQLF